MAAAPRAARAEQVVIIPFASIEQHGPHLPVDVDLRLAREVCLRAARRNANCLVMTPMAFGFEPHHMAWPGTIDVDWDVLIRYGVCVVSSLARHGFRRILIINGHGSNRPIMEMIMRLAQVQHPESSAPASRGSRSARSPRPSSRCRRATTRATPASSRPRPISRSTLTRST